MGKQVSTLILAAFPPEKNVNLIASSKLEEQDVTVLVYYLGQLKNAFK